MKTLDLLEAAAFLKMHPESVRRRAVAREIPSAKPGKHWVFIDSDLADWLRSQYATPAQAVKQETSSCCTADLTAVAGGQDSLRPTAKKYGALLALPTKKTLRSTKQN
jgi:hypothetical protein